MHEQTKAFNLLQSYQTLVIVFEDHRELHCLMLALEGLEEMQLGQVLGQMPQEGVQELLLGLEQVVEQQQEPWHNVRELQELLSFKIHRSYKAD